VTLSQSRFSPTLACYSLSTPNFLLSAEIRWYYHLTKFGMRHLIVKESKVNHHGLRFGRVDQKSRSAMSRSKVEVESTVYLLHLMRLATGRRIFTGMTVSSKGAADPHCLKLSSPAVRVWI
jgi:hypothetical protein